MQQILLPVYPEGIKMINSYIGVKVIAETNQVVYFDSSGPIQQHDKSDLKSFRYTTSQLVELRRVRQVDIIRTFKISPESAKRWQKVYRQEGASGFFGKRNTRKKGTILNTDVIQKIEYLFRSGKTISQISTELNIKKDTIQKGVGSGRIVKAPAQSSSSMTSTTCSTTASSRSNEDSHSPIGMGCTNIVGRVDALKKK